MDKAEWSTLYKWLSVRLLMSLVNNTELTLEFCA